MWLNEFKIALSQKDSSTLDKLINEVPKFKQLEDMKKASYLMREALILLHTLKDETSSSMKQIKKNIDFLNVTMIDSASKLDIKL